MADAYNAAETISRISYRTPLLNSAYLSKMTQARIYMKLECYQPTRVFKIRGAANAIMKSPADKAIVTASSGNHGFAVTYVCSLLGRKAIICLPKTANPDKMKTIEQYGGEIVAVGTGYEDAYQEALRIEETRGALLIHPFADPLVIAGQATIGLELIQDNPDLDTVIVPIGGGGLISGIAFAVKNLKKSVKVIGVQARNAPSMATAFRTGQPIQAEPSPTIADGLVNKMASEFTLEIIREYVDDIVLVTESELEQTVLSMLRNDHVLAEPSGAASVAALRYAYESRADEKVAAIVSGGNISIDYLSKLLSNH
jgi:threonine dehydratase